MFVTPGTVVRVGGAGVSVDTKAASVGGAGVPVDTRTSSVGGSGAGVGSASHADTPKHSDSSKVTHHLQL